MLDVKINAKKAIAGMERAKGKLKNSLFVALVKSTALVRDTVIENIKTGQNRNLGWPPFSPSTIKMKAKKGRSFIGLVDKGTMMTRIHEEVSKSKMEGKVFPGVNYLIYHEKGTRKMPEREIFKPVPGQVNNKIAGIFKAEVVVS